MNDGFEVFIGVAVCIVAICFIGLGFGLGRENVANHCKTFGAFEHGVIYECKEKSK